MTPESFCASALEKFLLTRPLRDVTHSLWFCRCHSGISTHTPLTGRDSLSLLPAFLPGHFYSHAPYGTWLAWRNPLARFKNFYSHAPYGTWRNSTGKSVNYKVISTHTPLTGRDFAFVCTVQLVAISTHTPLTGRDMTALKLIKISLNFYSHAPYGTWLYTACCRKRRAGFLLTRPLRDVTIHSFGGREWLEFLLTRPLRDVTQCAPCHRIFWSISTHTPLTGRDGRENRHCLWEHHFYSHAPYGTWQNRITDRRLHGVISTHTPLTGRDESLGISPLENDNFYSHAPYGTWQNPVHSWPLRIYFYSHAPYGTWPSVVGFDYDRYDISTHTPLTGRDTGKWLDWMNRWKFLLTRPLRDVTCGIKHLLEHIQFLLTRPLRDVTVSLANFKFSWQFLLTRPLRDVTSQLVHPKPLFQFLLTRPLRDVTICTPVMWGTRVFLLTRPLRDVTVTWVYKSIVIFISTHTPLTGRDRLNQLQNSVQSNFYSHAPYGTWLRSLVYSIAALTFLLTRPLRDVTSASFPNATHWMISTHTPLTGRDEKRGGMAAGARISTHTPLTGRDDMSVNMPLLDSNFYSHAPYGTWPVRPTNSSERVHFYSHAPYGTWHR